MSEIVESGTVDTAPTSTADAAEQVIDAFDAADSSGDAAADSGGTAPDPQPAAAEAPQAATGQPPAEPAPKLSEAEQLLHEAGYKTDKKPDGREHWIPRSKVLKIIENGITHGKGEAGQKYQALQSEAATLRGHLEQLRTGVAGDPKAFLAELAGIDPRYKVFLEPQAAPAAQQPAPDAEMPQPDLPLPDGSRTYSLEGIQKLLEWNTRRIEAKMDERLKPWAERDKAEQQRAQQERQMAELQTRTQEQMKEAQTWPLFGPIAADGNLTDFQAAVLGELRKDSEEAKAAGRRPTLTLEGAYIRVATPRLTEDDNARRARLLKEIQAAPKSTAVPRTGGEAPRNGGSPTTADIAARTLDRLERAGG